MSSLRDLVTGSDVCTPSGGDGAGPSNAMSALANHLLGGASKAQEQLREVCCLYRRIRKSHAKIQRASPLRLAD
jgi:hypothetical protein